MFKRIIATNNDFALTILRITLGIVMFPHGAQKMLGWFGGPGFGATMNLFTDKLGVPAFFAVLAILAEFAGSLGLILGLLTRIAAFGIAVVMIVAVLMVNASNGLFMNWAGNQKGEGFEFHLLAIAISLAILFDGGGAFSLDKKLSKK
ncbi:MAG: DoxX family protein [Pseudobdellovibrionaceae bacterium]